MMRRLVLVTALAWAMMAGLAVAQDSHHEQDAHQEQAGHGTAQHDTIHMEDVAEEAREVLHEKVASTPAYEGHAAEQLEQEAGGDVMGYLSHHLLDARTYEVLGYSIDLPVIRGDFSFLGHEYADGFPITKHMVGLAVAGLLAILLVVPLTGRTKRGEVPKGFGNFLEVLILFIRDEVVYPNMGRKEGRRWLPFFLTLFFLILFSNLLGMVPWGTTPTGNVNVTAGLAIATLLGLFFAGFREHGIKYPATLIPHGVPILVIPILFPIEVFGLLVKHFALTIRLFANMLAGHTVIGVFMALILVPAVALAAVPGAVAISMLELFVAFLQAYIFVMLGSLFVGQAIHPH